MLDAKSLSMAIRAKRKSLKEDGVENMVDTGPAPQMNAQDVWNEEKQAQLDEIPGADEIKAGPGSATMEENQKDDSQDVAVLKKQMARVEKILSKLSVG